MENERKLSKQFKKYSTGLSVEPDHQTEWNCVV